MSQPPVPTRYKINTTKQLIDLNGQTTNFELMFSIISPEEKTFEAVVVDQTVLDNNKDLKYQPSQHGQIKGTLRWDKNVYQNFFLVLRAPVECEVEVIIQKNELAPNPDIPAEQTSIDVQKGPMPELPTSQPVNEIKSPLQVEEPNKIINETYVPPSPLKKRFNWKWILVGVGSIFLCIAIWYFYNSWKKRKGKQVELSSSTTPKTPPLPEINTNPPTPKTDLNGDELLARLNKLVV